VGKEGGQTLHQCPPSLSLYPSCCITIKSKQVGLSRDGELTDDFMVIRPAGHGERRRALEERVQQVQDRGL